MNVSNRHPIAAGAIDLWFAEVSNSSLKYEQDVEQILASLGQTRLIDSKHPNRRREFLLGRALIRNALSHQYGLEFDHWIFEEKKGHAPNITNRPEPGFFSLTHSDGLIACTLSQDPVGIDLERIDTQRDIEAIAELSMTVEELKTLQNETEIDILKFYRLWCCKEAIFKMLPPDLQSKTSFSTLSALNPEQNGQKAFTLVKQIKDYTISIASTVDIVEVKPHGLTATPRTEMITAMCEGIVWDKLF